METENNHHSGYTVGLIYRFGKTDQEGESPSDEDRDGVNDDADECPETPRRAKVDEKGCALDVSDSDKDGVGAYKDECPESPEGVEVAENGCPVDEDEDGIADYIDRCPGTPEGLRVNLEGCVDMAR